jgi:hypothetical protein
MRRIVGIKSIDIALLTHRARVNYDPNVIGPRDVIAQLTVMNDDDECRNEQCTGENTTRILAFQRHSCRMSSKAMRWLKHTREQLEGNRSTT